MKIIVTSILVDDQDRAKSFYTNILGFKVKHDIPVGEYRWLTLLEAQSKNPVELILEPNAHPASKDYQKALFQDGIPLTMLGTDDIDADYQRLTSVGVKFKNEPAVMDNIKAATFDDTCGNLIMLAQEL